MALRPGAAIELAMSGWAPYLRQRENAERCEQWVRGRQFSIDERRGSDAMASSGGVYMPDGRGTTTEYADLVSRSPSNYAGLIVRTLSQMCFVDGVYRPGQPPNTTLRSWLRWQENGMDARQIALNRAAFGQGISYVVALPGRSPLTGEVTSVWRGRNAISMAAFYEDAAADEYPMFAIEARLQAVESPNGGVLDVWQVELYDEQNRYFLECEGAGEDVADWTFISYEPHGSGVCPVVRYAPNMDLSGYAESEIEPVIPLLRRIDQDTFDRLIVQRFGAWKIRYATGLAKPATDEDARAQVALLKMGELLVSSEATSKFGTLEADDIKQFIAAKDADLQELSAILQMPPYQFLGLSSNLQSEALETAKDGLNKRTFEHKTVLGESHESLFRLAAKQAGDIEEMRAVDMQVRWRDVETRSLSSTADALAKLADSIGVPTEMLFEMIPGWTEIDVKRALGLIETGVAESLLDAVQRQLRPNTDPPSDEPQE